MIRARGRVEVDCVRLVLHEAVSTGLRLSGLATFAGLRGVKMGLIDPRGGGAYDRPTTGCLLRWRPEKAKRGEFSARGALSRWP